MRTYLLPLLVLTIATLPAAAQQRVQQTGRALDANPQVGSGGVNNYSLQALTDYQTRNAVITGNVTGGQHFRGNIDYGAPGSFGLGTGGGLPSDTLFDFERRAASSAPSQLSTPYVGSYGGQNLSRVYRGSTNVPAYETGGVNVPRSLLQSATGLQIVPDELVHALRTERDLVPNRQNLGTVSDTAGQMYELSASPLLGLRRTPITRGYIAPDMEPLPRESPRAPANAPVRRDYNVDPGAATPLSPSERIPGEPDPLERVGLRQSQRVDLRQSGSGMGVADVFIDQPSRRTGLVLGQQLQSRMAPMFPGEALSDRVTQLEDRFFGRVDSNQAPPGRDVYMDLMRAAQGQAEREPLRPGDQRRQVVPVEEAEPDGAGFVAEGQAGARPGAPQMALDAPADEEVDAVEQRRLDLLEQLREQRASLQNQQREMMAQLRQSQRQRDLEREAAAQGDPAAADDRAVRRAHEDAQQALDELMAQLNYDLPPVQSMAGEGEAARDNLLRSAEQKLAAGDFMDATALYRQALVVAPDNPMVRAGLVHAQLGAGMVRSAGLNLRQLIEEHPELAAARYDAKLLPDAERLRAVQQELQRMINQGVATDEAGLLTAYLGYQAGSRQLVRYGLAVAQNAQPEDPLMPVLRAIWLDERAGDAAGGEDGAQVDDGPAPITE